MYMYIAILCKNRIQTEVPGNGRLRTVLCGGIWSDPNETAIVAYDRPLWWWYYNSERFEPRWVNVVVWVIVRVCSVVLRRTVVGVDWCFDNLSGSHHQSEAIISTLMMASAQVVETSVNTNNSPSQDYTTNPDDHSNHNNYDIICLLYSISQNCGCKSN